MFIDIGCYEDIRLYDYMLFDTVFLHRVNFMPVYLYNELFYYYHYDNSIILTKNIINNDEHLPGVLTVKQYVEYMNKRLRMEQFTINVDGYQHPIIDIRLNDISRNIKINNILNR